MGQMDEDVWIVGKFKVGAKVTIPEIRVKEREMNEQCEHDHTEYHGLYRTFENNWTQYYHRWKCLDCGEEYTTTGDVDDWLVYLQKERKQR